jgi:hypothetical protein
MSEIPGIMIYFSTDNVMGRSDALKLTGGGTIERGEHGELGSGLTRAQTVAWRPGDTAA